MSRSVEALLGAGMTVVTNPNLNMSTWMPSQPKSREFVFLACRQDVPRRSCLALCLAWRKGTDLECQFVHSKRYVHR